MAAALALAATAPACGPRAAASGPAPCAVVDSTLAARGLPRPFSMKGRATFDVEQYRVRGRFTLTLDASGNAVLEFSGATLMGGHREDVAVSLSGDTLRILDRERGRYDEASDAEALVAGGAGRAGDWTLAMRRSLTLTAGCPVVSLTPRDDGLDGEAADGPFRLRWQGGRMVRATWPDPAPGETFDDRLEATYQWSGNRLSRIELRMPTRGWRIRLDGD